MPQRAIPAVYMRGGTSKGVFFRAQDLPADPLERDRLLLRVIGSPDPYGKHIDGMGGATSSTSKIVIVDRSSRADCDVQFLFGQLAVDRDVIDYSGNCGNLTTAVGPFAITQGLVAASEGVTTLRLWQQNIGKPIVAHVPVRNGEPIEVGEFEMDGVPFPGAEIPLEFLDAGGGGDGALLPTGRVIDVLDVPGVGRFEVSFINAGNPTVFLTAAALGLTGTELQPAINTNRAQLDRLETIRAHAAVAMGLAPDPATATRDRPISPRLAFVCPPTTYVASSGKTIERESIDITARIISMGVLHHAFTGTGAVAIAVAAALPGSIVAQVATRVNPLRVGHVAGAMTVGADVRRSGDEWIVDRVLVSRSARRLMSGLVYVPS
jgi:2-methylaconitate isomerase